MAKNALEVCERPNNHSVYFDNFFSSYELLSDLDKKGFLGYWNHDKRSCYEMSIDWHEADEEERKMAI